MVGLLFVKEQSPRPPFATLREASGGKPENSNNTAKIT